jgi:PadR family transcriptional regulator PadR
MTMPTALVLRAFLEDPDVDRYGYELARMTGLQPGTLYPILARLEGSGWLESRWEDTDPEREGRPRRRYYRLGSDGREQARLVLTARSERMHWLAPPLSPIPKPA